MIFNITSLIHDTQQLTQNPYQVLNNPLSRSHSFIRDPAFWSYENEHDSFIIKLHSINTHVHRRKERLVSVHERRQFSSDPTGLRFHDLHQFDWGFQHQNIKWPSIDEQVLQILAQCDVSKIHCDDFRVSIDPNENQARGQSSIII
jgi:hypothetical protein